MNLIQILILALVQGAAELLPVSSSAHVIVAEKWMGLDPSSPQMTFLLVMLHTGTMLAVLGYFRKRWISSFHARGPALLKSLFIATVITGGVGLILKKIIEKALGVSGQKAEIEALFSNFTLIAFSLFSVGLLIIYAGYAGYAGTKKAAATSEISLKKSAWIGIVQALCLPFRGFSRSGATISAGLLLGISREAAEEFSFALAVILTPAVVFMEARRLFHADSHADIGALLAPGLIGMCLAAIAGWFALKLLSSWLERGRWSFFGYYCIIASIAIFAFR